MYYVDLVFFEPVLHKEIPDMYVYSLLSAGIFTVLLEFHSTLVVLIHMIFLTL